jgi:hypothetical protein
MLHVIVNVPEPANNFALSLVMLLIVCSNRLVALGQARLELIDADVVSLLITVTLRPLDGMVVLSFKKQRTTSTHCLPRSLLPDATHLSLGANL